MRTNGKRPGHRGDGRAAKGDQVRTPIAAKSTPETAIEQAARWYASNRDSAPRPLIPNLSRQFGISLADAAKALGMAGRAV